MTPNTQSIHRLELAREVLQIEAQAINRLAKNLNGDFLHAIDVLLSAKGRVVVTGMGKSGHIGRKIAATMASTGTPAFFVHPAEAAHGDLGMIMPNDILIALSNSGESNEVVSLLPALKRKGVTIIAMTGKADSTLAKEADIHLDASVEKEACPLGLAPTASTTSALALGDALAITLLDAHHFKPEDFALSHPGGSLGRRLLVHVIDVMHKDKELPVVTSGTLLKDALLEMSNKGLGMTAIVSKTGELIGVFTDGDLRRLFDKGVDLYRAIIDDLMHRQPKTIGETKLATEAVKLMEQYKINGLLVTDAQGKLVGALNLHDLFKAGVM